MTLEQLVEEFAQNVAAQTDAMSRYDTETANLHADQYHAALQKLRANGNPGRDALGVLLKHPRPDVKCAAAACLLRYRTAEATVILEELAQQKGLAALRAEQVLMNWKQGTWALDPG